MMILKKNKKKIEKDVKVSVPEEVGELDVVKASNEVSVNEDTENPSIGVVDPVVKLEEVEE